MPKKEKSIFTPRKQYLQLPTPKKLGAFKQPLFSLRSSWPQLLIIAICVSLYYTMIHFYLFFEWGFYIYYALKLVIAYEILSAALRSLLVPLCSLILGVAVLLFTNCLYLHTLMNTDTAWQLATIGFIGILFALFNNKLISRGK